MFYWKGVPKNFAKFTGKHLCRNLFFNKVAGLRPATSLKQVSGAGVFLWILRHFWEHIFYRTPPVAASFSLKSLGFINGFAINYFGSYLITSAIFCEMSQWFNLENALQTNGVTESDMKEVIKKQSENAPKWKDDEKTQMMQMIGLIRWMLT